MFLFVPYINGAATSSTLALYAKVKLFLTTQNFKTFKGIVTERERG